MSWPEIRDVSGPPIFTRRFDGGVGTQSTNDLFSPSPFGATWIRVNVHLDLITSRYKLTFGTYARGEQPLQHTIGRTTSHVEAKIGISCSPAEAGPLEVRYDNVTLNVR
jgi:hypothetical protein